MDDLRFTTGYLQHLYQQIASISAVLGGFSIAALTVLLTAESRSRIVSWAAAASGFAASLFIGTTFLASILASDAMKRNPTTFSDLTPSVQPLVGIVGPLFPLGMYVLLLSLGLCGWVRSVRTGIATSIAALIGAALITVGFVAAGG